MRFRDTRKDANFIRDRQMNEVLMEENKNHIASPPKSCLAEIWKMTHSFHYEQLLFCGNTSELPAFFERESYRTKVWLVILFRLRKWRRFFSTDFLLWTPTLNDGGLLQSVVSKGVASCTSLCTSLSLSAIYYMVSVGLSPPRSSHHLPGSQPGPSFCQLKYPLPWQFCDRDLQRD